MTTILAVADKPQPQIDGRTARAARTRRRIIIALLSLITDGELRPTAALVAQRAKVSVRSVFQHFADMEQLLIEAAEVFAQQTSHLVLEVPAEGPLPARLDAFVGSRTEYLEAMTPVSRATCLLVPFSAALQDRQKRLRGQLRSRIERVFATELDAVSREARVELIEAAVSIADWQFWEELRNRNGLSRALAERVQKRALGALFGCCADSQ